MQIVYGGYSFLANGVAWTTGEDLIREGDNYIGRRVTVSLSGRLEGSSQTDIATKSGRLRTALRTPYLDLSLRSDAGVVLEALTSAGSTTGVVCISGPNFTNGTGVEYATIRTFQATFEAEYPLPIGMPLIVESMQTVTTEGGFPINVWQRSVNGPPRKVMTSPQDTYRAVQSGRAVGLIAYPNVPPPLFPSALMDNPRITRASPERKGKGYQNYLVEWEYRFESATPLSALPGLPL